MDEKDFALRLAQLREKKNVSAREMSLAMGQNAGYINNIESGKSLPSLLGVFYICEYLGVSESEGEKRRLARLLIKMFNGNGFTSFAISFLNNLLSYGNCDII